MKSVVIESIAKILAAEGVQSQVTEETEIEGLDIDSLGLYAMLAALEDEYDVAIGCGSFAAATTVGALADAVLQRVAPVAKAA